MMTASLHLAFRLARLLGLVALLVLYPGAPPAHAARLAILDYHARNDPNQLLFTPRCNLRLSGEILPGDPASPDPEKHKGDY